MTTIQPVVSGIPVTNGDKIWILIISYLATNGAGYNVGVRARFIDNTGKEVPYEWYLNKDVSALDSNGNIMAWSSVGTQMQFKIPFFLGTLLSFQTSSGYPSTNPMMLGDVYIKAFLIDQKGIIKQQLVDGYLSNFNALQFPPLQQQ